MHAPCINSGAKVRGGTKRHTGRSFYEKPTGRLCEGRKRGLSLVRNAGRILGIMPRIQAFGTPAVCHSCRMSRLSAWKKKEEERKEPSGSAREHVALPVADTSGFRMRARAHIWRSSSYRTRNKIIPPFCLSLSPPPSLPPPRRNEVRCEKRDDWTKMSGMVFRLDRNLFLISAQARSARMPVHPWNNGERPARREIAVNSRPRLAEEDLER